MALQHISYYELAAEAAAQKGESAGTTVEPDSIEALKRAEAKGRLHHQRDSTAHTAVDGPEELEDGLSDTNEAVQQDKKKRRSYRDATSKITDALHQVTFWWILEFLPFIDSKQDEHGRWRNKPRYV